MSFRRKYHLNHCQITVFDAFSVTFFKKNRYIIHGLKTKFTYMNRIYIGFTLLILCFTTSFSQTTEDIKVNQVGYFSNATKLASVVNTGSGTFSVRNATTGATVFSGSLSQGNYWSQSGETIKQIDFSEFTTPGDYKIFITGVGESYPFKINDNVLDDVSKEAVRYFYYNRSSTALESQHAGIYARQGGHWDTNVEVCDNPFNTGRATGSTFSSPGGWYDAGDYNKYLLTAGISTYTLMSTYEQYPEYVTNLNLNIPESGNNIPDLLDECLYEIDWLLTMQDTDGGVYTKLSNQGFGNFSMPHIHDQQNGTRYVCGKNTSATLNLAATLAAAYRIFEPIDDQLEPGERESWRTAAIDAWNWCQIHPNVDATQCGCGIGTGEYPDTDQSDEFIWAAAELYLATGDLNYYNEYDYKDQPVNTPGWQGGKEGLGMISLLLNRDKLAPSIANDYYSYLWHIENNANALLNVYNNNPYDIMMSNNWVWGSNGVAGNQSFIMLTAYNILEDEDYLTAATANIDYILGKNTTSYSWFTGFGSKQVMDAHHRISGGDGIDAPVPGMVFGGAYQSAGNFVDNQCCGTQAYANTEVTVNWNAPFAFSTVALQAINGTPQTSGFNINIDELGNGSVSLSPQKTSYDLGDQVTITAVPNSGNSFFQWNGDLTSNKVSETITINSDVNLQAIFATPLPIPGTISPTDFNLGGDGIAYYDLDPVNNGSGPRPDENVDTEGTATNGSIGWIDGGEWVKYTVDVAEDGFYDLDVSMASPSGDGAMTIEMDDIVVGSITNITQTNDWSIFTTNTIDEINLTEGIHTMRLVMEESGFNLGSMAFRESMITGTENLSVSSKKLILFPNPADSYINITNYDKAIELKTIDGISMGIFTSTNGQIPVENLSPGVYLLIPEDKSYAISKFVKK